VVEGRLDLRLPPARATVHHGDIVEREPHHGTRQGQQRLVGTTPSYASNKGGPQPLTAPRSCRCRMPSYDDACVRSPLLTLVLWQARCKGNTWLSSKTSRWRMVRGVWRAHVHFSEGFRAWSVVVSTQEGAQQSTLALEQVISANWSYNIICCLLHHICHYLCPPVILNFVVFRKLLSLVSLNMKI